MKTKIHFLLFIFTFSFFLNVQKTYSTLIGYWHNWDYSAAPYIHLDSVDSRYEFVEVAFAVSTSPTDMTMLFSPEVVPQSVLIAKIDTLQNRGKKVLISIGGATSSIDLANNTQKTNFINSMTSIINTYGFDGIDIDIESGNSILINNGGTISNPANQSMINLIDAIKQIMSNYRSSYSRKMILTLAPETAYVQGGQSGFGSIWGGYLPIIHALRDSLEILQVQLYNSGTMLGLDGNIYTQGTADFIVAMSEAVIRGFNTSGGMFYGLPESKIAIGLPSCTSAAGGGFADTSIVRSAFNYLLGKGARPGTYTLRESGGYPNLRGLMTWSINWDAVSTCGGRYEFAENYQRLYGPSNQISCNPAFNRICKKSNAVVPFNASGTFNSGNIFKAQLSDENGTFSNPREIGSLSGTSSGTINVYFPSSLNSGSAYRIRVISTNPAVIGSDNGANITVNPLPTPAITPSGSVCVSSIETYSTPNVSGHKFKWSLRRGIILGPDTSSSVTINWTSAGEDSLKLIETNQLTSCSDTTAVSIRIKALPIIKINGSNETCENTVLEYFAPADSNYTYSWSVVNAYLGGSSIPNFMNISFPDAGTAVIKLVVTDNVSGCIDSISKSVVVNPLPKPEINGFSTVCQKNEYEYYSTVSFGMEHK